VLKVANYGGGSSGGACLLPEFLNDPTPCPRHTYDSFIYVDTKDALYMILGAYNANFLKNGASSEAVAAVGVDDKSTWKFTLADRKWHRISGNVLQFWSISFYETHMVHWKAGNKILFVASNGSKHAVLDLDSETWQEVHTQNNAPISLYHAMSAWDSKRDLWVFRNGTGVCTYNPVTKKYSSLPGCGISDLSGIAYDSKYDAYFVVGKTANTAKVYHPDKGRWEALGGPSVLFQNNVDMYLTYDPVTEKICMVTDADLPKYYTYKYVPGDLGVDMGSGKSVGPGLAVSPNPFKSVIRIKVRCKAYGVKRVTLQVYNIAGKQVAELTPYASRLTPNAYTWSATDLPSGIYILKATINNRQFSRKLFLQK
jgi:hypothetical protein